MVAGCRIPRGGVVACAAGLVCVIAGCDGLLIVGQPRACGGLLGLQCRDDEYCKFEEDAICGAADATGVCEEIPEVCTLEFAPVCGCDGNTYDNACAAAAEGVSVARQGECGDACGGLLGLECPEGQYCNYPEDAICGAADATGICAEIPDVCTDEFAPVCGCDDRTYGNACEAAAAGVSVAREGACGEACGGLEGLSCPEGQYCNFADGSCGAADQTGECAAVPEVCSEEFAPVCGCDDQTYDNACFAAAAGVSVVREGACGTACGGATDAACAEGQYCRHDGGDCGSGGVSGECHAIPDACAEIFAPVCGCDGTTYGNECEAARASVSVEHEGSCDGTCGGIAGFTCPANQYCLFEDGICGDGDQTGLCADLPESCDTDLNPVCGCDGMTYSNECTANAAGVSIRSLGDCPEVEPGPG